jgi:hypothetical protein
VYQSDTFSLGSLGATGSSANLLGAASSSTDLYCAIHFFLTSGTILFFPLLEVFYYHAFFCEYRNRQHGSREFLNIYASL